MKNKINAVLGLFMLLLPLSVNSQSYHVRFGFIGNSITIGSGLSNPTVQCYPSQLNLLLQAKYGDTCIVTNYAVSGRTMLKKGDYPWWREPDFTRCWNAAPDICFIMLGTNDSKPYNWDVYGNEFLDDYQSMIDTFRVRNPNVRFIICRPPPAFGVAYDIQPTVISDQVIPLIDSIIKMNNPVVVNFYEPLLDSAYLFPDKIHPNAAGAKVFAKIAFNEIVNSDIIHQVVTGHPFATSISSSSPNLRLYDSVSLSWTSINADEAFLNGISVDPNGSVWVRPEGKTSYTLVVKTDTEKDSITYTQNIYIPVISRLSFTASTRTIEVGDSTMLTATYFDQYGKTMPDSAYDINWSVIQGSGHFIHPEGRNIQFVGDSAVTAKIKCSYGDLSFSLTIKVNARVSNEIISYMPGKLSFFPNPVNNQLNVIIPENLSGPVTLHLYNSDGKLLKTEIRQINTSINQALEINTEKIPAGLYFIQLETRERNISGKFLKL